MTQLMTYPQLATAQVPDGSSILTAALQSGIAYPHGCKAGRCGSCKSRLLAGEIEHLPSSRFALTDDEKAAGYFLACRARAKTDVTVSWLAQAAADYDPRPFSGRVRSISRMAADTWRLELELPEPLPFQAGQFVQLQIGPCRPRSYSMANMPGEARLVFFIRQTPSGCASHLVQSLLPGAVVTGEGPYGGAFLRLGHPGPMVAVAGGSGLAPMKSIVEEALAMGMRQPIHLYFGARTDADLMLMDYFAELAHDFENFRFVPVAEQSGRVRTGTVGEALAHDWPQFAGNWHAYLAGPPPMVAAVTELLRARGVPPGNIFGDPFYAGPVEEDLAGHA